MSKIDTHNRTSKRRLKRGEGYGRLPKFFILVSLMVILAILISFHQNAPAQDIRSVLTFDIASAQNLATETAFPEDEAGLSAYINLGPLDFDNIKTASEKTFSEILDTDGGSYIYGIIPVSGKAYEASWTDNVHFYADTNGWLVAFFPKNTPSASLAFWTGGGYESHSILSNDNTLEQALKKFIEQLGVDFVSIKPSIKYYHFSYPYATNLTLFVAYGSKEVSFFIPEEITLYETSYNVLDNAGNVRFVGFSSIKLQGREIASVDGGRKVGIIKEEPVESTEEFKKPGGLEVGETFNVTVKNYPIMDRDGDGNVTTKDIIVDTLSVEVVAVYPKEGIVTLEVKTYSTVDMPFKLTYTGSKIIPVYPGISYELVSSEGHSGDLSVAMVFVYS